MKKTYCMGILFADQASNGLTHDFFAGIMDSFKTTMEERGHNVFFLNSSKQALDRETYIQQARRMAVDGIMISCIEYDDMQVKELLQSGIPVVSIDEDIENATIIKSDNVHGIQYMVHYLAEMGHRKIAYILGDDNTVTNVRLKSFYESCKEEGILVPDNYIRRSSFRDMNKAAYETEQLLRLSEPPTCILYSDDYAAIGGINVLHARGLVIPKDISVAGYDGIRILSQYEPRLTTVKQNTVEMGYQAAISLLERLEHPDMVKKDPIIVEAMLEKGRTVGRVYY